MSHITKYSITKGDTKNPIRNFNTCIHVKAQEKGSTEKNSSMDSNLVHVFCVIYLIRYRYLILSYT